MRTQVRILMFLAYAPFCKILKKNRGWETRIEFSVTFCLEIKGLVRSSCCCIIYNERAMSLQIGSAPVPINSTRYSFSVSLIEPQKIPRFHCSCPIEPMRTSKTRFGTVTGRRATKPRKHRIYTSLKTYGFMHGYPTMRLQLSTCSHPNPLIYG